MKNTTVNRTTNPEFELSLSTLSRISSPQKSNQNNLNKELKVLVIDDHRLFADGICTLLKEYDTDICTKYASNTSTAYDLVNSIYYPDLILLGINNTKENNYAFIAQLKQFEIDIPVMILSAVDSASAAGLAIENNASGFISKNCTRENILEAILSVLAGNIYISKPKPQVVEEAQNLGTDKITKRQHQVLCLLSKGLLNKQIAWELEISENTVKAHLSDLFRHLHVSNRTAAVKTGYDHGILM